jgi:hypothetical protein
VKASHLLSLTTGHFVFFLLSGNVRAMDIELAPPPAESESDRKDKVQVCSELHLSLYGEFTPKKCRLPLEKRSAASGRVTFKVSVE